MESIYDLYINTNKGRIVTHLVFNGLGMTKAEIMEKLFEFKIIVTGVDFEKENPCNHMDTSQTYKVEILKSVKEASTAFLYKGQRTDFVFETK